MIGFPHAKINLGLQIIARRQDGYHDIATCFYPIPVTDALEVIRADRFRFTSSGLEIPGNASENLCRKAYEMMRERFDIPPVHLHLHKVIPMGAGLGGGSSDGAFTLRLLSRLFSIETDQLPVMAAKLGSDCPFFLQENAMLATGTGTELAPAGISLQGHHICVVYPGIHVSTASAYATVRPARPAHPLKELLANRTTWKERLMNDFESPVTAQHPEIASAISRLYEAGAWYAAMSGSGSAVFGLFDAAPPGIVWPSAYAVFSGSLN